MDLFNYTSLWQWFQQKGESMSNEELVACIKHGDHKKIEDLWLQNQKFIRMCASGFHAGDLEDDLLQEGFLGLSEAVEKYDSERGYKFLTYAKYYIKLRMQRFLINSRPGVRIPEHMALKVRKYNSFVSDYVQKYGCEPLDIEAAYMLHMTDIEAVKAAAMDPASLDKEINEADGISLRDVYAITEDDSERVIDGVFQEQLRRDLWAAIDEMPEQTGKVLSLYYQEGKTYREISEVLGISTEQIRNIIRKACRELKARKKLRLYYEEIYGRALNGNGLRIFLTSWESSTERVALWLYDGDRNAKKQCPN